MVFNAFYEHDYHAGLVNLTAHILHTIKKRFHHYCHSLQNKKKIEILSKSLQKRPQSMRQIEQPLVQKLIAKRPKLMPYKK